MDTAEILVTITGIIAIILTIWYFFFPERKIVILQSRENIQEIDIEVKGGYDPSIIEVKKDIPVKLNFYRNETDSCSARVKFPDFKIIRELPPYKTTTIEFIPTNPGKYEFTCGMGMLKGQIIVK